MENAEGLGPDDLQRVLQKTQERLEAIRDERGFVLIGDLLLSAVAKVVVGHRREAIPDVIESARHLTRASLSNCYRSVVCSANRIVGEFHPAAQWMRRSGGSERDVAIFLAGMFVATEVVLGVSDGISRALALGGNPMPTKSTPEPEGWALTHARDALRSAVMMRMAPAVPTEFADALAVMIQSMTEDPDGLYDTDGDEQEPEAADGAP